MKIRITMNLDDEFADPDHAMGVTSEGYEQLNDALGEFGTDIDVQKAPDD